MSVAEDTNSQQLVSNHNRVDQYACKTYAQELELITEENRWTTAYIPNFPCQHNFLTGALFGETAGVSEQLEGLLEARCVLCGSIRSLDVRDESAHLPLGLTGGWREQTLIALVKRTGANRLCH